MRKSIILAAGKGTRLAGYSRDVPKCLLSVGGRTILSRQLDALLECEVRPVVVVVGYKLDLVLSHIRRMRYSTKDVLAAKNAFYDSTDNATSLGIGLDVTGLSKEVIIIDGDVVFEPGALTKLVDYPGSACLVNYSREACSEDARVELQGKNVRAIGKHIHQGPIYTSMIKVEGGLLRDFYSQIKKQTNSRRWYSEPLTETLSNHSRGLTAIPLGDLLVHEVDTHDDLIEVRRIFRNARQRVCRECTTDS